MSTNSKKHCYTVTIRRAPELPGLRYHVIAESKAQAKSVIANTMIEVERTDPIDLLDLRRDQVIDATEAVEPAAGSEDEQPALPLGTYRAPDDAAPIESVHTTGRRPAAPDAIDAAVAAFTAEPTAAEALEDPR